MRNLLGTLRYVVFGGCLELVIDGFGCLGESLFDLFCGWDDRHDSGNSEGVFLQYYSCIGYDIRREEQAEGLMLLQQSGRWRWR
jgi:hypothetical protein